jgi:hypothetical protein
MLENGAGRCSHGNSAQEEIFDQLWAGFHLGNPVSPVRLAGPE